MGFSLRKIIIGVVATVSFFGTVRVLAEPACPLTPLQPYKTRESRSVWYISSDCKKRPIKNAEVFFSHFPSWKSVRITTAQVLERVPNHPLSFLPWGSRRVFESGSLIKTVDDRRVFLVLGGNVYPIASEEVFRNMGYEFSWVEDVSAEALNQYRSRATITSASNVPPALVFKYPDAPDVFRLSTNGLGQLTTRYLSTIQDVRAIYRLDRIATLREKPAFPGAAATVSNRESDTLAKVSEQEVSVLPTDLTLSDLIDPLRAPTENVVLPPLPTPQPIPTPSSPQNRLNIVNASSAIGTNVMAFTDYGNNWLYANFFKQARPWISGERNGCWDCGPTLDLDSRGWVRSLQGGVSNGGHVARTPLLTADFEYLYPAGRYTILYDGEGVVQYTGSGVLNTGLSRPGRDVVDVTPQDRLSLFLNITQTNPNNYIRNIRVYPPGGACANDRTRLCTTNTDCSGTSQCLLFADHENDVYFYPPFLANASHYSVIRFMQAMRVNGGDATQLVNVGDYTELEDAFWTRIPPEMIARLGNALHSDVWVTIPVNASDALVRWFATRLEQTIDPDRRVYVEYSNESWNLSSPYVEEHILLAIRGCQNNPSLQSGCDTDTSPNNGVYCEGHPQALFNQSCQLAERIQFSRRTLEVGRIFRDVFHGSPRVVRVMASQSGNTSRHSRLLISNDAYAEIDVLATNPYFGGYLGNSSTVATWNTDQVFRELETVAVPFVLSDAQRDIDFLRQTYPHIDLVAYEGGQHLVGVGALQGNGQMSSLFRAVNRDPRMASLYTLFLRGWRDRGGKTFVHFADVSPSSQYGQFGALESQNQSPGIAPKYSALRSFATTVPCWWPNCQNATIIGTIAAFQPRSVSTSAASATTTPPSTGVQGTAVPRLVGFGDEFNNRDTLIHWANRTTLEGMPSLLSQFTINQTTPGAMTLIPNASGGTAWDNTSRGPFVYKQVNGDFVVSARLQVHSLSGVWITPRRFFNLGGLLVRNPNGSTSRENWILVSAGTQESVSNIGSGMLQATENVSSQFRTVAGPIDVVLRMCRLGNTFRLYRSTDNESTWVEIGTLVRTDLPANLQLGLFTVAGEAGAADVQVDVDYIRAGIPRNQSDCTGLLEMEMNPQPYNFSSGVVAPPPPPPTTGGLPLVTGFGDEFNSQTTLSHWVSRSVAEGTASQLSRFDVNQSVLGAMSLIPQAGSTWVNMERGPFVYKHITGNFVVSARINAHGLLATNVPPSRTFNAGGIMARSTASPSTRESWIGVNAGTFQTVSDVGVSGYQATDGVTTGYFNISSPHDVLLRMCRVGSTFEVYRSINDGQTWIRMTGYARTDLPETLQVGIFGAAVEPGVADVQIDVDYIRAGIPTSISDCTANLRVEPNPQPIANNMGGSSPSPSPTSPSPTPSPGTPSPSPSPSPSSPNAVSNFSDEFSNSATIANWSNRQSVEGGVSQISLWDINTTLSGNMVVRPGQNNIPWYNSASGPFIYKEITGDFVMSARLNSHDANTGQPPALLYTGGGLLVRNPASSGGTQNWITLNAGGGSQIAHVNTINSVSNLTTIAGTTNLSLRICRIGSLFTLYQSTDSEATWSEITSFMRADLPTTLQAGMMTFAANTSGNADVQVDYDYIRAIVPQSAADCTASIGPQ